MYRHTSCRRWPKAGLLERIGQGNQHAYSIPQEVLFVTRHTAQVRSDEDGHYLTVAEDEAPNWEGSRRCSYLSRGTYRPDQATGQSYYRNFYRSGQVQRIFCHEHTGLLERDTREQVEVLFKTGSGGRCPEPAGLHANAGNGHRRGRPEPSRWSARCRQRRPTTSSGSGGRGGPRATPSSSPWPTSEPHDLYFFDDPFEMIAGTVTPPGCFLDAPEMLKRQYLAFSPGHLGFRRRPTPATCRPRS